jgi:hypothetical protein
MRLIGVSFQGNQAYASKVLAGLFEDLIGKELTDSEITALGNRVHAFYASKGRRNILVSVLDRTNGMVTFGIRNQPRVTP